MKYDFDYFDSELRYEANTGLLFWKKQKQGRSTERPAGCLKRTTKNYKGNGYIVIRIGGRNGRLFKAHRVAWLLVTGQWPRADIDHINHDRADNRLVNLREATRAENMHNGSAHRDSTSGILGVRFHKSARKWTASLMSHGINHYLGLFTDILDAQKARLEAEKQYFGKFTNNKIYT